MAYDKKTGTITIASDDPKEFERDMFRNFEEIDQQLTLDPNQPPEIIELYEKLKKANKALDDYDKLKAITEQARLLESKQDSQKPSSLGSTDKEAGGNMKSIAIGLNVLLILKVGYLFATKGAPSEDEWFLIAVLFAAPLSSLVALTRIGGESLVGLYFKRKALEEKQRIKSLGGQ
jgi:hypothetical protein